MENQKKKLKNGKSIRVTFSTLKTKPAELDYAETALYGKEIWFLYKFFYPWLDSLCPNLDLSAARRVALAIATLADCDARCVQNFIEYRTIDCDPSKDVAWKTERNIYPRPEPYLPALITAGEIAEVVPHAYTRLCMITPDRPPYKVRWSKWFPHRADFEYPNVYGKPLNMNHIFDAKHHECMDKIIYVFSTVRDVLPESHDWWCFKKFIYNGEEYGWTPEGE